MVREVSSIRARWVKIKVCEGDETDFSITLPWMICSGIIGMGELIVRMVPEARTSITEDVPGGMQAISAVFREVSNLPVGSKIEIASDDSHILIECQ